MIEVRKIPKREVRSIVWHVVQVEGFIFRVLSQLFSHPLRIALHSNPYDDIEKECWY